MVDEWMVVLYFELGTAGSKRKMLRTANSAVCDHYH